MVLVAGSSERVSERVGWEGGVVVGDVEEDDIRVSTAIGKSMWAGFSLSIETESVRPLRSNL